MIIKIENYIIYVIIILLLNYYKNMDYIQFLIGAVLSLFLGGLLGWQRQRIGKTAGFRTYALVTFGSAFFTMISINAFESADQARVASQVITGIGFLGAGMIIHKNGRIVEGLTTAASLWASSAIGMAVGVGWYFEAITAALIMFLLLFIYKI